MAGLPQYLMMIFIASRNIDDVDKTMDEINEHTENMKQIQEALSAPIGAAADFDEVNTCLLSTISSAVICDISFHLPKKLNVISIVG